jgi:AGZA family xanthine/uracil permease-like MFS transporter
MVAGIMQLKSVVSAPPAFKSLLLLKFDMPHASVMPEAVFAGLLLLLLHSFESLGNSVSSKNPGALKLLAIDALGTPAGACLGLPNVSSSLEANPGGVATAGKSGLSSTITGLLFLAALFLLPVFKLLGSGVLINKTVAIYPVAAPVLVLVGFLALQKLLKINFGDLSDSMPACITLLVIPFTFNIAHGLAFGIIAYAVIKAVQGKFREISPLMYILAGLFLAYYIFF